MSLFPRFQNVIFGVHDIKTRAEGSPQTYKIAKAIVVRFILNVTLVELRIFNLNGYLFYSLFGLFEDINNDEGLWYILIIITFQWQANAF